VNECKPLVGGRALEGTIRGHGHFYGDLWQHLYDALPEGRGLHSSGFQLNLSAFCGIGVHVGIV